MKPSRTLLLWTDLFALLLLLPPAGGASAQSESWEQTRSIAESQYEIIKLLIQNQEFDKVLPTCRKLFSLKFPREQLQLVVESARKLVDSLIHQQQYQLAHQLIDEAFKPVDSSNKMKAALCKEKAYLFSKEGKSKEALKLWEKAIQLESNP